MTRSHGVILDNVAIPVTEASISYTKEPFVETSIFSLGDEVIYEGFYTDIRSTFGGAFRPEIVGPLIADIISNEPATHSVIVNSLTDSYSHYEDGSSTYEEGHSSGFKLTNAFLSSMEISVKAGELAKFSGQFTAQYIEDSTASAPVAEYASTCVPFYDVSMNINIYNTEETLNVTGFSIKIDRPYAADLHTLKQISRDISKTSTYIYDMRKMKVSGTVTLSQSKPPFLVNPKYLMFKLGDTITITIRSVKIYTTGNEMTFNGRSSINKTFNWTAPITDISISY